MVVSHRHTWIVPDSPFKLLEMRILPVLKINWIPCSPGLLHAVASKIWTHAGVLLRPPRQHPVRLSEVFVLIVDCGHIVHIWIEQVVEVLGWLEVAEVVFEQSGQNTDRVRYGFKKRTHLFELRHTTFRPFWHFLALACGFQILFYFYIEAKC